MRKILAVLLLGLVGCTTAHKASKYYDKNRPKALEYCVSRFPPRDSISEVIRYLQGEVIVDTIDNSHTDTFTNYSTQVRYVVKYKTITQIKTDTVTSIRTIYQSDKACVELLRNAKQLIVSKDAIIHQRTRIAFWLGMSWLLFILGCLVRSLIINRLNRG